MDSKNIVFWLMFVSVLASLKDIPPSQPDLPAGGFIYDQANFRMGTYFVSDIIMTTTSQPFVGLIFEDMNSE